MPDLITTEEATALGISRKRIYAWIRRGLLLKEGQRKTGKRGGPHTVYSRERILHLIAVDGVPERSPLETAFGKYNGAISAHLGFAGARQGFTVCGQSCPALAGGVCATYEREVVPLFRVWYELYRKGETHGAAADQRRLRECG